MLIAATQDRGVRIAATICGALLAGAALGACGASTPTGLSRVEAARLDAHIRAIRSAAAAHDGAGARTQLDDLLGDFSALRRSGRLSSAEVHTLAADVDSVRATLEADMPPGDPAPQADPAPRSSTAAENGATHSQASQSSTTESQSQAASATAPATSPGAPPPPSPPPAPSAADGYGGNGYGGNGYGGNGYGGNGYGGNGYGGNGYGGNGYGGNGYGGNGYSGGGYSGGGYGSRWRLGGGTGGYVPGGYESDVR